MHLKFTKMHGAGNDFVMIDAVSQHVKLRPEDIRRIADRRFGVGCDQVLLAEPPGQPDADFRYRIFNADGSESGQCGNGARCFARFVRHRKLTAQRRIIVETGIRVADQFTPVTRERHLFFRSQALPPEDQHMVIAECLIERLPGFPDAVVGLIGCAE